MTIMTIKKIVPKIRLKQARKHPIVFKKFQILNFKFQINHKFQFSNYFAGAGEGGLGWGGIGAFAGGFGSGGCGKA